jgi:hypothetical protein
MKTLTVVDLHQDEELSASDLADVVGGLTRAQAVLEALLFLKKSDDDNIEVEYIPPTSMRL